MDIRYSCNQKDFKRYTTEEMRDEMLITGLYKADEVVAVYSHVDRMVTLGCMPVHETVSIDKGIDVWANFGTHYFLERREIGMFNIGKDSTGIVVADGVKYELGYKDCLYITQGTKEVTFASADPEHPAKFYMVSAPAHCSYETRLIKMADANHRPLGSVETCNKRTINQFIHPDVLKTCQLSMGMTELEPGSNWNTMDLLRYTLQQSDNNACDILFNYQGGPDAVNKYIHSLGIRECAIVGTETAMHEDLNLCYENWTTPLAAAELVEIFRKKPLFPKVYKDFIFQTMVECQTGQDRLVAPLLDKKVTVGHKTGTGDLNAKGQQIGCNDIGFVLLPGGRTYSIAVFVKDSEENNQANSKIIADISRIVYEYVMQH